MSMSELIQITVMIGVFVWLYFNKNKKKIEKPSRDNNSKQRNKKTKFCSECGTPLDEDALFCSECGTAVGDSGMHSQKKSSIKKEPNEYKTKILQ